MMLAPNAEGLGTNDVAGWGGRVCALVAAGGYAAGALVSRSLSRDVDTTTAVALSMAMSSVILLPIWLITRVSVSWAQVESIPLAPIAALLLLGVMNTALAYVAYFRLIKLAGVTFAALNNYLVPAFGLFAGAVALGEGISPGSVLGLCLVLVGIALVGTRQDRRA
jgi:drug/metabolite transporter (DMT)-like permease